MKCTFIGHRDSIGLDTIIYEKVLNLIKAGVFEFYSGGMGNFDKSCEVAVKKAGGKLIYIPYNISLIKERDKIWYDDIICPFGKKKYSKFDIPNRNKWLVDNCDIFLCYVHKPGGAEKTYRYAIEKGKRIINISM